MKKDDLKLFKDFQNNILKNNLKIIKDLWRNMSFECKNASKRYVNNLSFNKKIKIQNRLNKISENFSKEILEKNFKSNSVSIGNNLYSAEEIRDLCVFDIRQVPKVINEISLMKKENKVEFLKSLRSIDFIFYKSILAALSSIKNSIKII